MRTYPECIPCFFRQTLEASRIAGASRKKQEEILYELIEILHNSPFAGKPPEMGRVLYGLVTKHTGNKDPYARIKRKSNQLGLSVYPKLRKKIEKSKDRLLTAVELAISGNVIDYGAKNTLNVDRELDKIMKGKKSSVKVKNNPLFDYSHFRRDLDKSMIILYLADNAGETVFDRILIEEIKRRDSAKIIYYVVKDKPIINDALAQDAHACGIDKFAKIISSGSDGPGTILSRCSKKFLTLFNKADLIISKGQGNFEQLSSVSRPIYFLLMAKCPVVAREVHAPVGDIILISQVHRKKSRLK